MWYNNMSYSDFQSICVNQHNQNRIVTWRILLGLLPGSPDEKFNHCKSMREAYSSLKLELEARAIEELPPEVFNPLSQDTKVLFNQEPMVQAFQESRSP